MKKLLILSLVAFSIMSCKQEKQEETVTETTTTAPALETETPEATASDADVISNTIEIEGTDQMTFNKNELVVKAGEPVTLTLKHVGQMPKDAMGHNWVLLKPGTDIASFGAEAMNHKDTNYVPNDSDAVIAHTDVVGGGESTTITFDAPEAGTYDFICSFPGHYANMKGKLIVK